MLHDSCYMFHDSCYMKKGFTLIELLIYMAILIFVLVLASDMVIISLQTRDRIKATTEVQQNLRFALEKITYACRKAADVNSPADNSSGSSLSLAMNEANLDPTLFSLSGGILQMQEGTNPVQNLTTDKVTVSSLTFYQVNNTGAKPTVQVNLRVDYKAGGNPRLQASSTGQTTISLR